MAQQEPDVLSDLDPLLLDADTTGWPWRDGDNGRRYDPDRDLLRKLLAVPIKQGHAEEQATGRVAKAVDAWIAHELRRSGFPEDGVWPRRGRPRVLPADLQPAKTQVIEALARVHEFEERLRRYEEAAQRKGLKQDAPSLWRIRPAINNIAEALPGSSKADVLGRFYTKEVDVVVSAWQRGPDVLVSSKTQFTSYLNNKNNRYEEAIGEAKNLRDRYPMAAMGYAYLVRDNVFVEGAFQLLRDLLVRLRKPDGPFDATMLIVADWDDSLDLGNVEDPAEALTMPRFFADLINAVTTNTPVDIHQEVRLRQLGEPPKGGLPPAEESVVPEE